MKRITILFIFIILLGITDGLWRNHRERQLEARVEVLEQECEAQRESLIDVLKMMAKDIANGTRHVHKGMGTYD